MKKLLVGLLVLSPLTLLGELDEKMLAETKAEAEGGCAVSARQLGEWYEHGVGAARQDMVVAAKWYLKAAELGDEEGQASIGSCYLTGAGVPQNYFQAYVWLSLAAVHGGVGVTEQRDEAAEKLSQEQLAAAQKEAARLPKEIKRNIGPLR